MAVTYTSTFINPYPNGWENLPAEITEISAEALQPHTDAIQAIDTFLAGSEKNAQANIIEHITVNGTEATVTNKTVNIVTGGGGATALSDLTDVTLATPTQGQVLKYDGTKWVNGEGGSGGTTDYESLDNLPTVNGVELIGNKTSEALKIVEEKTYAEYYALTEAEKMNGEIRLVKGYPLPQIARTAQAGGGINYSTEEQDTGLLWIDGRNVFQRTYTGVCGTDTTLDISPDYDIVEATGYAKWKKTAEGGGIDMGAVSLGGIASVDSWALSVHISPNDITKVIVYSGSTLNSKGAVYNITLRYVKPLSAMTLNLENEEVGDE